MKRKENVNFIRFWLLPGTAFGTASSTQGLCSPNDSNQLKSITASDGNLFYEVNK